jgi:chromate reductase, NAD(P)H dehydrogenase (quinone)
VGERDDVVMNTFDAGALPLFKQDIDGEDAPEAAKALKTALDEADAVFFACPEYNYSMTAALKNALDWGSTAPKQAWQGKAGAIAGAGGGCGTARAQLALRQCGVFLDITFVNGPEVCINRFAKVVFNEDGDLIDEELQSRVSNLVDRLVVLAQNIRK